MYCIVRAEYLTGQALAAGCVVCVCVCVCVCDLTALIKADRASELHFTFALPILTEEKNVIQNFRLYSTPHII
jgi:hypothetical protein